MGGGGRKAVAGHEMRNLVRETASVSIFLMGNAHKQDIVAN